MNEKNSTQTEVFLKTEGDQWFKRNIDVLSGARESFEVELIKRILTPFNQEVKNILEIGCSNGRKLEQLCEYFKSHGKGVDPSSKAVEEGNSHFKAQGQTNIELITGAAQALPFAADSFDLVFFGFCLYLVDRSELFQAISAADRVLKPGGFLAILDFDPIQRHKRPYHHKEGLFTYKNQYSRFFTESGHYYLVAKESFSHGHNHFSKDGNERISINILYKEPDAY